MAIAWKLTLTAALILTFATVLESKSVLIENLIVGGELAPIDAFPYQVGLYINKDGTEQGTYWCGGTLIYADYVLTAAHCLYGGTTSVAVIVGTNDIENIPTGDRIYIQSSDITINADFDPTLTSNDIALIRLPNKLSMNAAVQTIQLALSTMNQDFLQGQTVSTSGWGDTNSDTSQELTEELHYVNLTVISLDYCAAFFNGDVILPTNICTNGWTMSGPCNGDSGGPLTYRTGDGSLYLVGITSFGNTAGCQSGYPNAYTRITSYLDWIANNTGYTST